MNEVTLQQIAFGHWEVIYRNINTGTIRHSLFATWEKDEAERCADRRRAEAEQEYLQ